MTVYFGFTVPLSYGVAVATSGGVEDELTETSPTSLSGAGAQATTTSAPLIPDTAAPATSNAAASSCDPSVVELYLIRHGQSVWNERGLAQGQARAPGLTPLGRKQASQAAEQLSTAGISLVLSSDLRRAVETAEIIAANLGLQLRLEPRLRERALGRAEGHSWRLLQLPDGNGGVADGKVVDPDARPPGGESVRQLVQRVGAYLDELVRDPPGERLALVTHGGVMKAALVAAALAPEASVPATTLQGMPWSGVFNGRIERLELARRGPAKDA